MKALDGFDMLTRHSGSARKSLDQLDKTAEGIRSQLRDRLPATAALLQGTGAGTGIGTALEAPAP